MIIPVLTGDAIVLRPLEQTDAPALFLALSDPQVQLYRHGVHADIAETARYIEESRARGLAWAITEAGGEALGRLVLRVSEQSGEYGIVVRRNAHRRGLARKALGLTEAYAFGTLKLARLTAAIDPDNAASLALFERAGFKRESIVHGARRTHLGLCDSVIVAKPRIA